MEDVVTMVPSMPVRAQPSKRVGHGVVLRVAWLP